MGAMPTLIFAIAGPMAPVGEGIHDQGSGADGDVRRAGNAGVRNVKKIAGGTDGHAHRKQPGGIHRVLRGEFTSVCDGEMDDGIVVAIDDVKILVVRRNSLGHGIDAARIIGGLRNRDQRTGMSVRFVDEDLARSAFRVRDEDEVNGPCITTRGNKQTRA